MLSIEDFASKNTLFDNRYRLIRPLSTDGGTADVWLANDTYMLDVSDSENQDRSKADNLVAIKIYRPKNALDINGEKIFREEYKIVQNCKHTNLLHPSHFSIFEDTPYLELPYCKNGSSETLIGKHLTEKEIWKFIKEVADGLTYLHALVPPIIHQDIKPANILIDDYGSFAITDFGISATLGGSSNDYSLDEEYSGTMAYMAPERFDEDHIPNPESDIWAFGATLYEILSGNVPFSDYGGQEQLKVNKYEPLSKDVPFSIRKLIDNCLNIDPKKRPSANQIAEVAARHLDGHTLRRIIVSFSLLVLLFVCGVLTYFFISNSNRKESLSTSNSDLIVCKTDEEILKYAVHELDNTLGADALRAFDVIDSLSNTGYIPAMYEKAFTYGWFTEKNSLKRKIKLNIEIFEGEKLGLPQRDKYNNEAIALFQNILENNDTTNADIKAHSAYRLAIYYVNPNQFLIKNKEKGEYFLKESKKWATIAKDRKLLEKIDESLKSF